MVYGEGSHWGGWPVGALRESMCQWEEPEGTLTSVDKGRVRLTKEVEKLP